MERIRKFISNNLSEDQMEIDLDFTDRLLSQFDTIDRQTIDVLIENGYQTKEQLLAFDLKEDLPLLPVLNMGQKSLLRKVLKQYFDSEDLEVKIYDMKGDDSQTANNSIGEIVSPPNKRKRESIAPTSAKRVRSSPEKDVVSYEGWGSRMKQMVNKRKSIRRSNSQTDSDNETEFLRSVDPKRFQFANNDQFNGSFGGRTVSGLRSRANTSSKPQEYEEQEEEEEEEEVPEVVETKPQLRRGRQSLLPNPTPPPRVRPMSKTARKSIMTPYMTSIKTEPKTTPKTSSPSTHIPTPTELEVRERLAQKKALSQQKGRKRR